MSKTVITKTIEKDVIDAPKPKSKKFAFNSEEEIETWIKNKNKILAVLGGNPESPGCAIHMIASNKKSQALAENSGVFMEEFHRELCNRKIIVPFRGMRDCRSEWIKQDLEWLEDLFNQS